MLIRPPAACPAVSVFVVYLSVAACCEFSLVWVVFVSSVARSQSAVVHHVLVGMLFDLRHGPVHRPSRHIIERRQSDIEQMRAVNEPRGNSKPPAFPKVIVRPPALPAAGSTPNWL